MEQVTFIPEITIRVRVAAAFASHQRRLAGLLPEAGIHHVGSTAVPGSLTKGDLDLQVRVPAEEFGRAETVLAGHYARNVGSTHTPSLASFTDDTAEPPLGIQLTAIGGPEDFFCRLRDFLIAHPETNEQYNALKARFEGGSMIEYRAAKSDFPEALLAEIRYGEDSPDRKP